MEGVALGLTLPFLGTLLGSSCVFFMTRKMVGRAQKILNGFAAGVMIAASVWSLLMPSMEMTNNDGFMKVFPAMTGFLAGMGFLLLLDMVTPHFHASTQQNEGPKSSLSRTTKLMFAITLHNIPEGMAVGVAIAAALENSMWLPMSGAIALTVGIAIQNFPEGAIVSMPFRAAGNTRRKSFALGTLSGVVEPVAAVITILVTEAIRPILPYILAFAAGSMIYVVVEELIPETQEGEHSNLGTVGFALGFVVMMVLDVVLG